MVPPVQPQLCPQLNLIPLCKLWDHQFHTKSTMKIVSVNLVTEETEKTLRESRPTVEATRVVPSQASRSQLVGLPRRRTLPLLTDVEEDTLVSLRTVLPHHNLPPRYLLEGCNESCGAMKLLYREVGP